MRPRIKQDRSPKIVFTTSKDKTLRDLAKFNREQDKKKFNIDYVLCVFGKEKQITKEEYESYLKQGLNVKIITK